MGEQITENQSEEFSKKANEFKNYVTTKAIIWAEINALEREFRRLQSTVVALEKDKQFVLKKVRIKLDELQDLHEINLKLEQ